MNPVETWHAETLGKAACEALKKNGFDARYVATGAEALSHIESFVKSGSTVGLGGSMTVKSLGTAARLESLGAKIIDHSAPGFSPEQKMDAMRAELTCDVFLSSSNAITLDGEIFNIDGNGNRVAALTFGPKKTIVVAGFNKIVKNLAEAEERCKLIANPMNCKRLDIPTPCSKTGYCVDCQSDRRICRAYSILKRRPSRSDFTVIIVGERLGY
jgi:L-lactate utilization protein LutB